MFRLDIWAPLDETVKCSVQFDASSSILDEHPSSREATCLLSDHCSQEVLRVSHGIAGYANYTNSYRRNIYQHMSRR